MASELTILKISALKLGTAKEISTFLQDLDYIYNRIYVFDFLVNNFSEYRRKKRERILEDSLNMKEYGTPYSQYRRSRSFLEQDTEPFIDDPVSYFNSALSDVDIADLILPGEELRIIKININSPGFWEFSGVAAVMQQVREYIT